MIIWKGDGPKPRKLSRKILQQVRHEVMSVEQEAGVEMERKCHRTAVNEARAGRT
jgi:hypothetical protein